MPRGNRRRNRPKDRANRIRIIGSVIAVAVVFASLIIGYFVWKETQKPKPEELLVEYMNAIEMKEYHKMYTMLDTESRMEITEDAYVKRLSNIYEGIDARNIKVENLQAIKVKQKKEIHVTYETAMDTVAGEISFSNKAIFQKEKEGFQLIWNDSLIFPELEAKDKVQVSHIQAKRGRILDREGRVLAGDGIASSVGIVPGKLEADSIEKLAPLLEMTPEAITKKLEAKWVKEDSFVPVKTLPKIRDTSLLGIRLEEDLLLEVERQEELLSIPGIMISDLEVRGYELGKAASHLIGYVQGVTAEDLEKHVGEGYHANSVIGRNGMEGLFEKELKGQDGYEIRILNEEGDRKESIAFLMKEDGEDIQLTIDMELQSMLYNQFSEDKGCSVAMNPKTGEVLALVSTPSFDNNEFIRGLSQDRWDLLNEDEAKPMFNRFRQTWCPGSTLKPIVAAAALQNQTLDPNANFGNEGLAWQKDDSWGAYTITTLRAYDMVTMENALMYSDNIYFAKVALQMGAKSFQQSLESLGFLQELPFEISMTKSKFSNTEQIKNEIQLADSGYGQGEILINPLHLASLYTAFGNNGDVIKPYLVYQEVPKPEIWIKNAFSSENAELVLNGMKKVINDTDGTGYAAHMEDIMLAGKTGTAEIKAGKDDTQGTELGWFAVMTVDPSIEKPIVLISMVEGVKEIGGSSYVLKKDKAVLEAYFH